MDINDAALNIHAARGFAALGLGFRLCKKPDKTSEEAAAAKSFLKVFWWSLGLTLLCVALLAVSIGGVMAAASAGYAGNYEESRTGRIEDGKIRYVKDTLFYISPQEVGLSAEELPEGTHVTLYFDENDRVVAAENADALDEITERRVVLTVIAMGAAVVILVFFALVAKKTFGKPWYRWVQSIR